MKKSLPWILVLAPVLGMALVNLLFWSQIPLRIPTHWNVEGDIDRWGSRDTLWVIPGIFLLVTLFVQAVSLRLPGSPPDPNRRTIRYITGGLGALFFFMHLEIVLGSLHGSQALRFPGLAIGLGFLMTLLGLGLKHCQPTAFVGIRTPWTLRSEDNWQRTHRLASRTFLVSGLLMTALAAVIPYTFFLVIIMGNVLAAVIYSYRLHRGR